VFEYLSEEVKLSRTAAKIYLHILRKGETVGVREIARELKLPPSTVHYNLKKLEELGLIEREGNGYKVKNVVSPDELIPIGGRFVPKLVIYSFFFLGVFLGFVILSIADGINIDIDRFSATLVSLAAFVILFLEGLRDAKKYSE